MVFPSASAFELRRSWWQHRIGHVVLLTACLTHTVSAQASTAAEHEKATIDGNSWVLRALAGVGLGWYCCIWSVCLLGLRLARQFARSESPRSPLSPPRPSAILSNQTQDSSSLDSLMQRQQHHNQEHADSVPGVSILRPLSGLDSNLYSNLSSSFTQDYPNSRFEVILSVRDATSLESQKVLNVARMVVAAHPHVDARIIVGDQFAGVNPKINNLVRSYAASKYDILWVVDSQVWSPSGALARAVDDLCAEPLHRPRPSPVWLPRKTHGQRVGLVHHVPFAVLPSTSWGSRIERIFLSTTHAKMYLALNALSIDSCVMGKSNMYRKSDLACVPDSYFNVTQHGSQGEEGAIGSFAFSQKPQTSAISSTSTPKSTTDHSAQPDSTAQDLSNDQVKSLARPLARFSIYLAEDNMLAQSLWNPPLNLSHTPLLLRSGLHLGWRYSHSGRLHASKNALDSCAQVHVSRPNSARTFDRVHHLGARRLVRTFNALVARNLGLSSSSAMVESGALLLPTFWFMVCGRLHHVSATLGCARVPRMQSWRRSCRHDGHCRICCRLGHARSSRASNLGMGHHGQHGFLAQ